MGFEQWWRAYPSGSRRAGKFPCHKIWVAQGLEDRRSQEWTALDRWKLTKKWTDGYWPAPKTYLNARMGSEEPSAEQAGVSQGSPAPVFQNELINHE